MRWGGKDYTDMLILRFSPHTHAGADIEMGASTPLMEASQEGHVDIVKFLIQKGANIHATTNTGDTALTYACANGHTLITDILLQCGADLVGLSTACCHTKLWIVINAQICTDKISDLS